MLLEGFFHGARKGHMKRFTAISLTLVLLFAMPAAVGAKSYTGAFRISVTIPASINSSAQPLETVTEITEGQKHSADVSIVETVRGNQPVVLKTSVVR